MEKPPNTDILGWYVNKLYKKALDHCLQNSAAVPAQGQVYRGQGHADNYVQSPACNYSMLNGDLSTCKRTIQKDDAYQCRKSQSQKSNFQSLDSRSTELGKQSKLTENRIKVSNSQEMCHKQPHYARRLRENTILSERRCTVSNNGVSNGCQSDITGNISTGRQHVNEIENYHLESSKLEQFTMSKSNTGFYGPKDSYSQQDSQCNRHKYIESKLKQVVTHDFSSWGRRSQPTIFQETENVKNSRCEMLKSDIQTLKPNRADLSWFRHSVQPQQTNTHLPMSQSLHSKDDHFLFREHSPNSDHRILNVVVPSCSSVNMERESNNLIPCQHSDSINKAKWLSQSTVSHQHPAKIDSMGSENTSPHQHSAVTNTQFLPSTISNDRPVNKTSIDSEKTETFKSSIFYSLKSNVNSNQCLLSEELGSTSEQCRNKIVQKNSVEVKSTGHSAQHQSHNKCNVHSCSDVLEVCEQWKSSKECCSYSPRALPDQAKTDNSSMEGLQRLKKEGTNILFDPDGEKRLKTASCAMTTPLTNANLVDRSDSSHNDPPAGELRPDDSGVSVSSDSANVVTLTNENLKLHHEVMCGSSPRQDNAADSDSGESCKSGVVIKPGHSNQKRKRSLSLDKKGNKRHSSGTTKNRTNNPTNAKRTAKSNKKLTNVPGKVSNSKKLTNVPGKVSNSKKLTNVPGKSSNKKTDKNSKSKKGEKRVGDTQHPVRGHRRNSANVVKAKVKESKPTVKKKKDKNASKTFKKSNKKSPSGMSEHLKQCIGREISILKAHEDQAMSINSDSECHSIDSKRLSSLAFLDLKDLAQVPEPNKSLENQSVYMSKKHVGGVWNSIVKK